MRVVCADSGAALLDEQFKPTHLVASVSVLVEPPYREPSFRLAEPIFREVDSGFEVIVHEAELCLSLLSQMKADVVHLDVSLGGVLLEDLSPVELMSLKASRTGRQNILKILPRLRKIACEIKRLHGIDMLAIGKESVPVRVAELTVGAEAILFACRRVVETKEPVLLGLPHMCEPLFLENTGVDVHSLIAGEHDLHSFALDSEKVLTKVKLSETLNPVARGFRALKVTPI
ncbi:MAG: DUF4152 family protein [Candidatus Bathyarchaeota archaeon]|nr:DUF4152 family protein [Candidatus Bathyarchaeota archaeon]